jgi:hypothetical protein
MKNFFFIGLTWLAACSDRKEAAPQPEPESSLVTAKQKAAVRTSGSELKVELLKVTDSRCPINALCITAGDAELTFNITDGSQAAVVVMHFQGGDLKKDSKEFKLGKVNYMLIVKEVLPYPTTESKTPLEEYTVNVSITKS